MRIALFGSTGRIGSRILVEALNRGHEVTAVVRDPARAPDAATSVAAGDVTDSDSVAAEVVGHDAVVSSVSGFGAGDSPIVVVEAARALIAGLTTAGVDRLVVVGGAGSLITSDGARVIDGPDFPDDWKPGSSAQIAALDTYRTEGGDLRWTYLSPAHVIEPGERTATFVLGGDELVVGSDGESRISMEDYAVALVDELEQPRHVQKRFTLAYR